MSVPSFGNVSNLLFDIPALSLAGAAGFPVVAVIGKLVTAFLTFLSVVHEFLSYMKNKTLSDLLVTHTVPSV